MSSCVCVFCLCAKNTETKHPVKCLFFVSASLRSVLESSYIFHAASYNNTIPISERQELHPNQAYLHDDSQLCILATFHISMTALPGWYPWDCVALLLILLRWHHTRRKKSMWNWLMLMNSFFFQPCRKVPQPSGLHTTHSSNFMRIWLKSSIFCY